MILYRSLGAAAISIDGWLLHAAMVSRKTGGVRSVGLGLPFAAAAFRLPVWMAGSFTYVTAGWRRELR